MNDKIKGKGNHQNLKNPNLQSHYETPERQRIFKFQQISPGYLKYLIWEICCPALVAWPNHVPYVLSTGITLSRL